MTTPGMSDLQAPGVYRQDVFPSPPPTLLTGVPVFLGLAQDGPVNVPVPLTLWPRFEVEFGPPVRDGYLADAVRGFFQNDGLLCYVVRLDGEAMPRAALRAGLAALDGLDAVDLVCVPDVMHGMAPTVPDDVHEVAALQGEVLDDCRRAGGRLAILDVVLTGDRATVELQRADLTADDGGLYHPWLWVVGAGDGQGRYVPPCGHVAGVYARGDRREGVHKAPANEPIEGVLDLRVNLTATDLGELYDDRVNCLVALPGRGIRVWGSRTLSDDPSWRHVGARRVFLTLSRWLERFMTGLVHEPNDVRLWVRIMRELTAHLDGLSQRGALKGSTADEAFFVKCDSETNPPELMEAGVVVTDVGLALAAPAEFVVARIIHGASGVSIQTAPTVV